MDVSKHGIKAVAFLFISIGLTACGGGGSNSSGASTDTNASTIAAARVIAPGAQCANGGIEVNSGIDDNRNGVLDASEIDESQVLCNGEDGSVSLIATSDEPMGSNCLFGGTRIDTGLDSNDNGILDVSEYTASDYICALSSSFFNGLVYLADANLTSMEELFRADNDTSATTKLAGPRLGNNAILSFKISPDRTKVAFIGNLSADSSNSKLYVSSLLDGKAAIEVSGAFMSGGNVYSFQWSPDSSRLAYHASQEQHISVKLTSHHHKL